MVRGPGNRKEAAELVLEDSTVANGVLALARNEADWSGIPQTLYQGAVKNAGNELGSRWPKTISKFGSELRRIASQLRVYGLSISFERRGVDRVSSLKMEDATAGLSSNHTPKS